MVDADSPINETLMSYIRTNLIHLEQWIGDAYVAAKDHDHDNANSAYIAGLGANTVAEAAILNDACTVSKVKKASNTISGTIGAGGSVLNKATTQYNLSVNLYAFQGSSVRRTAVTTQSYVEYVGMYNSAGAASAYTIYYTYLSASKPIIVVSYLPKTGEIESIIETDENNYPPKAFDGSELKASYAYDANGNEIEIEERILPDDHDLIINREKINKHIRSQGRVLSLAIFEDYEMDDGGKIIKLKPHKKNILDIL